MPKKLIKLDESIPSNHHKLKWIKEHQEAIVAIKKQLDLHCNYLMEVKVNIEHDQIMRGVDNAIDQYKYIDECFDEGKREAMRSNMMVYHNPKFIRSLELRNNLSSIAKYAGRVDLSSRRLLYLLESLYHYSQLNKVNDKDVQFISLMIKAVINNMKKWDERLLQSMTHFPKVLERKKCDGINSIGFRLLDRIIDDLDDALIVIDDCLPMIDRLE
ncbi:MAG TPA: hypothetical protein QF353_00875 [Gammaproteobacteria bacterium]|nr:hypothetical protein [Gammaproteobacteria bacterium]